jgi:hypothetical protein
VRLLYLGRRRVGAREGSAAGAHGGGVLSSRSKWRRGAQTSQAKERRGACLAGGGRSQAGCGSRRRVEIKNRGGEEGEWRERTGEVKRREREYDE